MSAPIKPEFFLPIYFKEPVNERGPCPRNREIFDAVRIRNASYRAAAKQFNLSPARIGQIVKEVTGWVERTGGGPPRTWGERDRLNEFIHRERLQMLYSDALTAWKSSDQVNTTRFYIEDGKPQRKVVTIKTSPGEKHYWEAALKSENARYAFEKNRPHPPETEEMTAAEKLREARMMAERALAEVAAAEAAAHDEARTTTDEEVVAAPEPAPSPSPAAEIAPEPVVEAVAPIDPPEPAERLHFADPPYAPNGQMRLTKCPSDEALEQFWATDEYGRPEWRPPIIVSGDPNGPFWSYYTPRAPDEIARSRVARRKREKLEREAEKKRQREDQG